MRAIAAGLPFAAYHDVAMTPTHLPDLVHVMLDLLIDGEVGIWHLANSGPVTWYDFARRAAELAGLDRDLLVPVAAPDFIPRSTALTSERAGLMGPLDEALERWRCAQARPAGDAARAREATDQLLGADLAPSSA
jgi:dTDP-4-dehydrorhamnose reductase